MSLELTLTLDSTEGDSQWLNAVSIAELLPTIKHYITYEGSLTQPACHETVQWIVLNKPIYMSTHQFHLLRHSLKSDGHGDNYRPTQQLNHRSLRSNIFNANQVSQYHTQATRIAGGRRYFWYTPWTKIF